MGDISNGDGDDISALIVRIGIGLGMDGVVVILGVGRVDGSEGQVLRQSSRPVRGALLGCLGLFKCLRPEKASGMTMGMNGDRTHRPFRFSSSQ